MLQLGSDLTAREVGRANLDIPAAAQEVDLLLRHSVASLIGQLEHGSEVLRIDTTPHPPQLISKRTVLSLSLSLSLSLARSLARDPLRVPHRKSLLIEEVSDS